MFHYTKRRVAVFFSAVLCFAFFSAVAHADHAGPEKIVDGKYVVTLLMTPEGGAMKLRFFFRDINTGKNLTVPILFHFTVRAEGNDEILFASADQKAENGIGEATYQFPRGGVYSLRLEFEKEDEPGKRYAPDGWSLWISGAGKTFAEQYPIGLSEIFSFLTLISTVLVLGASWRLKKNGKTISIPFFEK